MLAPCIRRDIHFLPPTSSKLRTSRMKTNYYSFKWPQKNTHHELCNKYRYRCYGSTIATELFFWIITLSTPLSSTCYTQLRPTNEPPTATSSSTCVVFLARGTFRKLGPALGCTCIRSCGVQGNPHEDRTCYQEEVLLLLLLLLLRLLLPLLPLPLLCTAIFTTTATTTTTLTLAPTFIPTVAIYSLSYVLFHPDYL